MARYASTLQPGELIGDFRITKLLGAGGFGITYMASHVLDDAKVVAIKEFYPRELVERFGVDVHISASSDQGQYTKLLLSFINEGIRLKEKIKHPNIVRVNEIITANNTAYLVMDYVFGQTLDDALRIHTRFENTRFKEVFLHILSAVEYLHKQNVIHRDLTGANIILDQSKGADFPILIDFGASGEIYDSERRDASLLVANLRYAPPEQLALADRRVHGPFTDIFSLAVLMYRAISGEMPLDVMSR